VDGNAAVVAEPEAPARAFAKADPEVAVLDRDLEPLDPARRRP
jgi:hypothetical protein